MSFLLVIWLIPSANWVWNGRWEIMAANLLLINAWVPAASYYFSFNGVSWSISTEAFFYLLFPFLICRLDRSWWWKLICVAAFVATLLCLTDLAKLPPYNPSNLSAITAHGLAYVSPLVRILEFVFGMAVASLCKRCRELRIVTSSPARLWTAFELGALAITLWCGLHGTRFVCSLFDTRSHYACAVYAGACACFPAFGVLIGVLSFERGIVSRFLSANWLVALGEISYSIYLVHWTLVRWYMQNRSVFTFLPKTMLYIAYWLAVLGVSFIIWRVIEKPCQRWIRSLFGLRRDVMAKTASIPGVINS